MDRPPLGLKPRHIHDDARMLEIIYAIVRHEEARTPIPKEWWEEMRDLMARKNIRAMLGQE
jgi:hypothetical protein